MGIAKISPLKKEFTSNFNSFESSLAKAGFNRMPGTARTLFPYKEMSGNYRTGLDEKAAYLFNMPEEQRNAEIERIKKDKARLEAKTGFDLSPNSSYYDYSSNLPDERKVFPVKLTAQDKFFDLKNPADEITWNWIKVHPAIAPSLQAYKRGDVHPDMVQYYVADDAAEEKITYNKKQEINKAIVTFEKLDPSKRKKIGRLMGLPVTDDSKEEVVYNLMDTLLKDGEFKSGEYKGNNTVTIFSDLVKMNEDRLHVKDLVGQAITHAIYRVKLGGRVYEGDEVVAGSKEELVNHLLEDTNQEELLALEKRLNVKKFT